MGNLGRAGYGASLEGMVRTLPLLAFRFDLNLAYISVAILL